MATTTETVHIAMPTWYRKIRPTGRRVSGAASQSASLGRLKEAIRTTTDPRTPEASRKAALLRLVKAIHDAMFLKATGSLLRDNRLLHPDGLPAVFTSSGDSRIPSFPFYIRSDAEELYNKWAAQNFETDLMHGVRYNADSAPAIKLNYKFKREHAVVGNNGLINGQWWPAQLCAVRDGAHGSAQGGIAGRGGEGAFSIVLAEGKASNGEPYPDFDSGEEILYCGTDGEMGVATAATNLMLETYRLGNTVRVIRSSKCKEARYRPEKGFRYDGLYRITEFEILDSVKARHRFTLVREPFQDPIRFEGPGKRPTPQELREWDELWKNKKFIVSEI